jgi:hypothetical protein
MPPFSFWSLNHVDRPERVLQEVGRVLKPEGRFLIVLEDMPPALLDWPQRTFFTLRQVQRANIGQRSVDPAPHRPRALTSRSHSNSRGRPAPLERSAVQSSIAGPGFVVTSLTSCVSAKSSGSDSSPSAAFTPCSGWTSHTAITPTKLPVIEKMSSLACSMQNMSSRTALWLIYFR